MTNIHITGSVGQPAVRLTLRTSHRGDLDNAIAAIELALEYVGKLGDFDVNYLTDIRDRLVVARDSLVLE
jgi:hypothetical protein